MALIDLTGQKFGRLTVLYRDLETEKIKKDRHAIWKCQCECGNQKSVVGKDLRAGRTQSCGCLQKERTSEANGCDLLGKTFGKLTVIKQSTSRKHRTMWVCLCECGNIIEVCARELQRGDTCSCGCLFSKGQAFIAKLLTSIGVQFKSEYIFSDYPNARFDFAILENQKVICLIEYDGPQHFKESAQSGGWNTLERYEKITHPKDLEKNIYCKEKNIPLLRIPYTQYKNLNEEKLKKEIEKCIKHM